MVLAALAEGVVAGDGRVPTLVATLTVAPLIGLLLARTATSDAGPPFGVSDVAILIALTLILAANLLVVGDFARAYGFARLHAIAAGALLTLLVVASPAVDRGWRWAMPLGTLLVVLPLGAVAATAGAPWTAWANVATRPALTFDARSAWITSGRAFGERTVLTFDEVHRVVAATPATWRVIERDPPSEPLTAMGRHGHEQQLTATGRQGVVVREWTLGAGDALTLRPGDQLAIEAGARVRFERGRRIPNGQPSGIAWANGHAGRARATPLAALGTVVTLVGGALALSGCLAPRVAGHGAPPARGRIEVSLASFLVPAFVIGATAWGVYGIAVAPELAIVPWALAPLVELTARLETATGSLRITGEPSLSTILAAGIVALFVGLAYAWRLCLRDLLPRAATAVGTGPWTGTVRAASVPAALLVAVATIMIGVASGLATFGGEPWQWFRWALGLAASAAAAPRLALAGPRGELVGALFGGIAFGAAVAGSGFVPGELRPLLEEPALLAAPIGWASARLARRGA